MSNGDLLPSFSRYALGLLAFPAEAQQPTKIPRIGWLAAGSASGVAPSN